MNSNTNVPLINSGLKTGFKIPFELNSDSSIDEVIISQGWNGKYSHKINRHSDYRFSVDFVLDVGTKILASKEGVIKFGYDDFEEYYTGLLFEEGKKYFGNQLIIQHDDGTCSHYEHLKKDRLKELKIETGNRINVGDLVGLTGLSGWIGTYPHLHFSVFQYEPKLVPELKFPIRSYNSKPMKFDNYSGSLWDENI